MRLAWFVFGVGFLSTELDAGLVARVGDFDVAVVVRGVLVRFARDRFLAGRTELLAVVPEDGVAAVAAVRVGHRRPLQQEFAHLLGCLSLLLLFLELLSKLLPFGFLVEVAHTCHNDTALKTLYGSSQRRRKAVVANYRP